MINELTKLTELANHNGVLISQLGSIQFASLSPCMPAREHNCTRRSSFQTLQTRTQLTEFSLLSFISVFPPFLNLRHHLNPLLS